MYEIKRNTIEYLRETEEFLEYASKDMKKRDAQIFVCPCPNYIDFEI
jgi:hypothetical protein